MALALESAEVAHTVEHGSALSAQGREVEVADLERGRRIAHREWHECTGPPVSRYQDAAAARQVPWRGAAKPLTEEVGAVAESMLFWMGLLLAAGVAAAQLWMAAGRHLVLPAGLRAAGWWTCAVLGALYLGLALADALLRQRAGALSIRPYGLGVALLLISLTAYACAAWHLMWVLREDEQARRAGDRAQRAVLAGLREVGVEAAVRATGSVDWATTAERLEAGLVAGVFSGSEAPRAAALHDHCRILADAPSVLPLKLRAPDARARGELADLQRIARTDRPAPRPPRKPAKRP